MLMPSASVMERSTQTPRSCSLWSCLSRQRYIACCRPCHSCIAVSVPSASVTTMSLPAASYAYAVSLPSASVTFTFSPYWLYSDLFRIASLISRLGIGYHDQPVCKVISIGGCTALGILCFEVCFRWRRNCSL